MKRAVNTYLIIPGNNDFRPQYNTDLLEFVVYYSWWIRDKDHQMYEEILPKIIQWIKDNYDKIPYLDNSNEYYRICITPNNTFELSVWSTSHNDRKYSYKKRIVLSSNDD